MRVPDSIVAAINTMLAPYGDHYTPGCSIPEQAPSGYLSPKEAAAYIGCSRSFLYTLGLRGELKSIKLNKGATNGKVVYSISDLENYINRCRS